MFTPGPSTMSTPSAIASRPIARPISRSRPRSQVAALHEAVGKQVAALAANAMDSVRWVRRTPWGPSAMRIAGSPSRGSAGVVHAESPVSRAAFSSSVIAARTLAGSFRALLAWRCGSGAGEPPAGSEEASTRAIGSCVADLRGGTDTCKRA